MPVVTIISLAGARGAKEITQQELAFRLSLANEAAGLVAVRDANYVRAVESGKRCPNRQEVVCMAESYGLKPREIAELCGMEWSEPAVGSRKPKVPAKVKAARPAAAVARR